VVNKNYFYNICELNFSDKVSIRYLLNGFKFKYNFCVGDIVEVVSFRKNLPIVFEGICISISKKSFLSPQLGFKLRNIIFGVSIEMTFSFYYNRLYNMKLNDYKKKTLNLIRSSKIYYIRYRLNRESAVK